MIQVNIWSKMPKRKSTASKRGYKRRRTMGRKRSRGRQYGNKRPKAIQRATKVPKTAMIKFVYDKTFLYTPAALPSGTDPMVTGVIDVSCNNIIQPVNTGVSGGTWTAQDGTAADPVEGLNDWVGTSGGRYQKFMVLGSKIDVNTIASAPTTTTATQYVNNYAMGIHKCTTGADDVKQSTQLPDIQKMPYTRLRNLTGALLTANTLGTTPLVPQGGRVSDTYSAKKWEGVTNVKDNAALQSKVETTAPGYSKPAEGGKFQLFFASREPKSTNKQVPSQLVRVKIEYITLLTDPITSDNDPMLVN